MVDVTTGRKVSLENLREMVLNCSGGREVWSPDTLVSLGFPSEIIAAMTTLIVSDPDRGPTEMLFGPDGEVMASTVGVSDLNFLRVVCKEMGLRSDSRFMGRGRRGRELAERILTHLDDVLEARSTDAGNFNQRAPR